MFGSSGWWNWSITCGCGGPKRRANATNCAASSVWARNDQHLVREERALELGERRVGQRPREVDARGFDAEAGTKQSRAASVLAVDMQSLTPLLQELGPMSLRQQQRDLAAR